FGHNYPGGGSSTQIAVPMQGALTPDPGGWPLLGSPLSACCPAGNGVGWNNDGHGEIIGHRGPRETIPLGIRLRTSPQCGSNCIGLDWPARSYTILGGWNNGNGALRKQKLMALENLPGN